MGKTKLAVVLSIACATSALATPGGGKDAANTLQEIVLARKRAEALEKAGDWVGCGRVYRDIYSAHPRYPQADEVLYNAGVCFEESKSVGLALQMYALLRQRFSNSRQSQKALVRSAVLHASTASFGKAAELYEDYAKRYAAEKDAPMALSNAASYRRGLGQYDRAIADIELYVRQYKRKYKGEAAAAFFGIAGLYEAKGRKDKAAAVLKRYLKEFGRSGGRERIVIALARLGEIEWQLSCPIKASHGRCMRIRRNGKAIKVAPVARNKRRVAAARKYFRQSVQQARRLDRARPSAGWGAPAEGAALRAKADYWHGAARFYLAEASTEALVAKGGKAVAVDKAVSELAKAAEGAPVVWRIASAARTGQLYLHLGQPVKATAAFRACLDTSMKSSWFTELSRLCEAELQRLQPKATPPMREILSAPRRAPLLSRPVLLPDPR